MEQRTKFLGGWSHSSASHLLLFAFSFLYLIIFFPYAYFRHDDWVIIGNGVLQLPGNWSFALSPTLILNAQEVVWFFRPLFKIGAYLLFSWFGYHYYTWLCVTLVLTLGALQLTYVSLLRITQSAVAGILFLVLFICSLQFHFGSVIWVGEGLMNCPVLFLLALNTWAFVKGSQSKTTKLRLIYHGIALLAFSLSLGFKEIGILHALFLACLNWQDNPAKESKLTTQYPTESHFDKKPRIISLIPYFILAVLYLVFRLWVLPVNPGYIPQINSSLFGKPLALIFLSLSFPTLALVLIQVIAGKNRGSNLLFILGRRWPYLFFLALSILPYIGHHFFSAGWLLLPGYYLSFILALAVTSTPPIKKDFITLGILLFLGSGVPLIWKTYHLEWWKWKQAQRQIIELFAAEDATKINAIKIYLCNKNRETSLDRVVGSTHGLAELWAIQHRTHVDISQEPCPKDWPQSLRVASPANQLNLVWDFPKFILTKK